ncbi:hypothetical protein AB2M62_18865 [Sphingomonas sp. MMS12-HWE2-04]|uniref:hypothetical protein n=1 Tax=Sphingomonas sp. MMS12-HWE2-04 TaxID=3234199 RepID=UPI00384B2AAA
MKRAAAVVALLAMLPAAPAFACLPPRPGVPEPPPPTDAQFAEAVLRSTNILEGQVVRGTYDRAGPARFRITHVYKGALKPGIIEVAPGWGFDPPPCFGMTGGPPPVPPSRTRIVIAFRDTPELGIVDEKWLRVLFERGALVPSRYARQRVGTGSAQE